MNRNSEKVVTTVVLGVAALIGSLIAVALFGSEQPIRKVFSTAIIIDANTRLTIQGLPYASLPMGLAFEAREKLKAHPELLPDIKEDSFAQNTYQHLLQRAMLYWLEQKYPGTWKVDVFPLNLGEGLGISSKASLFPRVCIPRMSWNEK
jgi:hypothetical protein